MHAQGQDHIDVEGYGSESFPIGILGQVWYLIVAIHDLCTLTYFNVVPISYIPYPARVCITLW